MLGRLCKWLRAAGFYVEYIKEGDILARVEEDKSHLVLTRDKRLKTQLIEKGIPHLFIEYDRIWDQLAQIVRDLKLDLKKRAFSRCIRCNAVLKEVAKEEVKGKVPSYVFNTQEKFCTCPLCSRIFWSATHRRNMARVLYLITEANLRNEGG
jgi:hypothetical protein